MGRDGSLLNLKRGCSLDEKEGVWRLREENDIKFFRRAFRDRLEVDLILVLLLLCILLSVGTEVVS